MAERVATPNVLLALAAAGAAAFLGLLAGYDPRLALGAALGGAFVAVVLHNLTYGMCVMAMLASLDGVPSLSNGAVSAPKAAGLLLGISWLATLGPRRDEQLSDARPFFAYILILFLGWHAITLGWAEDRSLGVASLTRYAPDLLLFPIAYAAIRTERHLRWMVVAMAAAALISATLSVVGPADPTAANFERASGLAGGANELAAALVVGIALCIVLALTVRSPLWRLVLIAGTGVCVLGLFLSLSRGGLVALGAALVVSVLVGGRWRGRMLAGALIVSVMCVGYFGAVASLPARERVLEVGGGTGRTDLWTVGSRMVEDKPVIGVGAGNFQVASIHYLLEPGVITSDEFIITTPKVAHNTFLEVLAEAGVIGLVLFLAIVGASLWWMLSAARKFSRLDDPATELVVRGLVVATSGYLVAGLFISANYSKLLWLLLALGPACYAVARRRESSLR
jgi:O-antigen ligase